MRPSPPLPEGRTGRLLRAGFLLLLLATVFGGLVAAGALFLLRQSPEPEDTPPTLATSGETVRAFYEVDDEGEAAIEAALDVALGRVTAARAEPGTLFQAEVLLAGSRLRPRFEHGSDGDVARIALSLGGEDVSLRGLRGNKDSTWRLYFSDRAPLDLRLQLGAAEADLDLSGIPLRRLALDCGMASATIRFDSPNPVVMEEVAIQSGLSSFTARGLGNTRFEQFDFDGGAGDFLLDFSGQGLLPGAEANIDVGMASLTILLPRGLPVVLDAPGSFMTRVSIPASFEARGRGRWASPGVTDEAAAFRLDVDAGPGSVEVRLTDG